MTAKARPVGDYCYARLPQAGLGNMLFVWARALVYAHLSGSRLITSTWTKLRIGPLLRREKSRRRYGSYFKEAHRTNGLTRWWVLLTYPRINEPSFDLVQRGPHSRALYVFSRVPHWSDYFDGIRDHRELVRANLREMVADRYLACVDRRESPVVGVHVRCGDFRELRPGEDFAQVGAVRTPLAYFQEVIRSIRAIHGSELPVTVFSDGHDKDLAALLAMPNVRRAASDADIVDLLLLSRSRVIVASAGSTFGYWAGFLADAPLILHPDHIHVPFRPDDVNRQFFEGGAAQPAEAWPALLIQNIRAI